jgi:hypothetical protein
VTPLSDALTAAQRSALAALEKAYVAGEFHPSHPDEPSARAILGQRLSAVGISDPVDITFLAASLDVLREWGVSAPTMSERITEAQKDEPASQKQLDWIAKLVGDKGWPMPEGLSKEKASQAIDELQAGTYDPEQWELPF